MSKEFIGEKGHVRMREQEEQKLVPSTQVCLALGTCAHRARENNCIESRPNLELANGNCES